MSKKRAPERLETRIPRLDDILKGGLWKGGIYTLIGHPGTGKTIMANQICFGLIERGGLQCLYVTLLAETHAKMMHHLTTLQFFKPEVLNKQLMYVSAYSQLKSRGVSGALATISKLLRAQRPALLVVDGLQAIRKACAHSDVEFDDFIHKLQALVSLANCTTLLLTPPSMVPSSESVGVDGIIELRYGCVGPRAVRELIVRKLRGSDFLSGKHELEINAAGIQVHPRTEVQFDAPDEAATGERGKVLFGSGDLDAMLGGGLLTGTTLAILGSPGVGKTLLGLSCLSTAAESGFKCVYLGFSESPPTLVENAQRIGISLQKHLNSGQLEILWRPTLEQYLDSLAEDLLERFKGEPSCKRCLLLDGFAGFRAAAIYPNRLPRFIAALSNQLRLLNVTTLITDELDLFHPDTTTTASDLVRATDGAILLEYLSDAQAMTRRLSILKMRNGAFDPRPATLNIGTNGMRVLRHTESTGTSHAKK